LFLIKNLKTKSLKYNQIIEWNLEYTFDLIGVDITITDVEVAVYCSRAFIGEVVMTLHQARIMGEGKTWHRIHTNNTSTHSGELQLEFLFNF